MILANTSAGLTVPFDLEHKAQREQLLKLLESQQVTGLSILVEGRQYTLARPTHFKQRPIYGVECVRNQDGIIGEKIFVQADDVRGSVLFLYSSKLVRYDLTRTGRMQYIHRREL